MNGRHPRGRSKVSDNIEVNVITTKLIAAAFTEWERQYREEPEQFATDQEQRALEADTYGALAARTLLDILEDLKLEQAV